MAGQGGSPAERLGLVPASMVAGQAFCEYKVHLEVIRGGVARTAGLARRIARRVVIRDRRGVLARASVLGEVLGVPVAASPDFVVLGADGSIYGVGRSAIRGSLRIFESDIVYLRLTGLLVWGRGDGGRLVMVVAGSEGCLKEVLDSIASSGRVAPSAGECYRLYVEVYDSGRALDTLAPLLEYWRGLRPPRPSPSRGKCGACPFRAECEFSAI